MKSFKELIRSRRGIAIEFAIGVMFVSVAISTILISTAVLEGERRRSDMDKFETFISESNTASLIESIVPDMIANPNSIHKINGNSLSLNQSDGTNFEFKLENNAGEKIATIIYDKLEKSFTYDWH